MFINTSSSVIMTSKSESRYRRNNHCTFISSKCYKSFAAEKEVPTQRNTSNKCYYWECTSASYISYFTCDLVSTVSTINIPAVWCKTSNLQYTRSQALVFSPETQDHLVQDHVLSINPCLI